MTKFYTSRSAVRSNKAQTASYLQSRLQPLSLLGATPIQLAHAFALHHQSKNTSGNIQINYLTAKGESVTYTHCVTKTDTLGNERVLSVDENFNRIRFSPQHISQYNPKGKYTQPEGSGTHIYFTALYQVFINPKTKTHSSNFDRIYVVEGEFKAWTMCLAGLPTVAISGISSGTIAYDANGNTRKEVRENELIPFFALKSAEFKPDLQAFLIQHQTTQLVLLHDADAFNGYKNRAKKGRVAAFISALKDTQKACEALQIQFTYIVGKNEQQAKGIDDLLLTHLNTPNYEAIINDLTNLNAKSKYLHLFKEVDTQRKLNTIIEHFYRSTQRTPDLQIEYDGYLSDLINTNSDFLEALNTQKRIILQSGTGSGKTTLILRHLIYQWFEDTKIPTIVIVPLNAIVEQQSKYGNQNDVAFITAATKNDQMRGINLQTKCVFVNYENAKEVAEYLTQLFGGYHAILDESHLLSESVGYKADVVREVTAVIQQAQKTLLASATPSLLGLDEFYYLKINNSIPAPAPKVIHYTSVVKSLTALICQVVPNSGSNQIVLLNNKKRIQKLKDALKRLGYKIATIYTNNPNNEHYQQLINTSKLDPNIDVYICTEKVATGVNILSNGNKNRLIYAETNTKDGFLCGFRQTLYTQFVARVRDVKSITDCFILTKQIELPSFERQTAEMIYCRLYTQYQQTANDINARYTNDTNTPQQHDYLRFVDGTGLTYSQQGLVVPDKIYLIHLAEKQAVNLSHVSDLDFEELTIVDLDIDTTIEIATKEANKAINEETKNAEVDICNKMSDRSSLACLQLAGTIYNTTDNQTLKNTLKNEFGQLPKPDEPLSEIKQDVADTAHQNFMHYLRLGMNWGDAHQLTFRPSTEKIRPSQLLSKNKRQEIRLIISRFLSKDANGCKIKQHQLAQNEKAQNALLLAFEKSEDYQLTPKEIQAIIRKYRRGLSIAESLLFASSLFHLQRTANHANTLVYYKLIECWDKESIERHFQITLPTPVADCQNPPGANTSDSYEDDFGNTCPGVRF
jgi:hypothetical protein